MLSDKERRILQHGRDAPNIEIFMPKIYHLPILLTLDTKVCFILLTTAYQQFKVMQGDLITLELKKNQILQFLVYVMYE